MNITNEVSNIEAELAGLREREAELQAHLKAMFEFAIETLRRDLGRAQADRDNCLRHVEAIRALLDPGAATPEDQA